MDAPSSQRVLLAEANRTVRRLMKAVLEQEGFETSTIEAVSPETHDEADPIDGVDLVVIDRDEPVTGSEQLLEACLSVDLPVLQLGLRNSAHRDSADTWLTRPFASSELLTCVMGFLEGETLAEPGVYEEEDTTAEYDYDTGDFKAGGGEGLSADTDVEDVAPVPPGLEDGGSTEPQAVRDLEESSEEVPEDSGDDEAEVLEIDDTSEIVLEVEELGDPMAEGGTVGGPAELQVLDLEQLRQAASRLESIREISDGMSKPTLPAVPAYRDGDGGETGEQSDVSADETSAPEPLDDASGPAGVPNRATTAAGTATGSSPTGRSVLAARETSGLEGAEGIDELGGRIDALSEMIVEAWNRLGLAARPGDRLDRVRRVLHAGVKGGLDEAAEAIGRIPPAEGFAGDLEAFPLERLLAHIREAGLRGRLEISDGNGKGSVLFVDERLLQGIEDLSGRGESRLLEVLRELGHLDDDSYETFRETLDETFGPPLEMQLREDSRIDQRGIDEARETLGRQLLVEALRIERGAFAFVRVGERHQNTWPVEPLEMDVEAIVADGASEGFVDPATRTGAEAGVAANRDEPDRNDGDRAPVFDEHSRETASDVSDVEPEED